MPWLLYPTKLFTIRRAPVRCARRSPPRAQLVPHSRRSCSATLITSAALYVDAVLAVFMDQMLPPMNTRLALIAVVLVEPTCIPSPPFR